MIQACRDALYKIPSGASHAGLLLASYLRDADSDSNEARASLLREALNAAQAARPVYRLAFDRWKAALPEGASKAEMKVPGRAVVGLGGESVLETGIRLHHTYGVPIIPGTALKGLTAHYASAVWSGTDAEFSAEMPDGKGGKRAGKHYETLFGTTDDSGHICFHDAWILPECLNLDAGLLLDVMTPHHPGYYMSTDETAPTDFDDPNPVTFLSVTGRFLVAVECDVESEDGKAWAKLALRLLGAALRDWGVGGKTSSGYGRMNVEGDRNQR